MINNVRLCICWSHSCQ